MSNLDGEMTGVDDGQNGAAKPAGPGARGAARGIVTLGLIAFATAFAVQNSESVDVSFLVWDFSMSKILLMLVSAFVGVALWVLIARFRRRNS